MDTAFTVAELRAILDDYDDDRPVIVPGRHDEACNVEVDDEDDDHPDALVIRPGLPVDA